MPTRCTRQFLSRCQTSSPRAHHNENALRKMLRISQGVAASLFHRNIVLDAARTARIPAPAVTYPRPDETTRISTPPPTGSDCQPGGRLKDPEAVVTGVLPVWSIWSTVIRTTVSKLRHEWNSCPDTCLARCNVQ